MPRFNAFALAIIAMALLALVGCAVGEVRTNPPTMTPLPPTTIATPTMMRSSPTIVATPTAILTDPEPGPVSLAFGANTQKGRRGYATWCVADPVGTCTIYDRYGGPVPLDVLPVPQGATLTFTYLGANTLSTISTLLYPWVPSGQAEYPVVRGGTPLPTTQTQRQAAITVRAPPGEYVLIVRVSGAKNTVADFQFHIAVG